MIVHPAKLLDKLRAERRETEWIEFKVNKFDCDEVGRYVSGLANSAMLAEKGEAYLVFGVEDRTLNVVGTLIQLKEKKVGNQSFEHWLTFMLKPRVHLQFVSFTYGNHQIEMIVIDPAFVSPVYFKNEAFIRVDSIQQPLRDFPQRERAIWGITSRYRFEDAVALAHLSAAEVLAAFDCGRLLAGLSVKKTSDETVIEHLLSEGLIIDDRQEGYDASNLLAITAALDLQSYATLRFKAPRVIVYKNTDKLTGQEDVVGRFGYAVAFTRLLRHVMSKIPKKEIITHGVRSTQYAFPEKAVREFLANTLIHQDMTISDEGPTVEIYEDRIKFTNPGKPLINPDRFIDAPPKSRNKKLAEMMRRSNLCESRGSGVDRALEAIEGASLPPPLIQIVEESTVVTMYAEKAFAFMTKDERLRACYQHACLRVEAGSAMSNSSLRARLGLNDKQYSQVSIVIRDAIDEGLIAPQDEDQGNRNARYVPWYMK